MRAIYSLLAGTILGSAAVLLHDAYRPWGLLFALFGTGVGIWLVGRAWGLRRYKFLAAVAWCAVFLRAGSLGIGGELLVQGNSMGNALMIGGLVTLVLAIVARS
ncbi:MAG TPA: hypothetical protein VF307_08670 [Candidatus Nanopelagicaceae bacterium]